MKFIPLSEEELTLYLDKSHDPLPTSVAFRILCEIRASRKLSKVVDEVLGDYKRMGSFKPKDTHDPV